MLERIGKCLLYVWPLPNTLLGLLIGCLPFLGKREFTIRRGTIGIYGSGIQRLLSKAPIPGGAIALTLGHVILAADKESFQVTFEHEWIHVKQYIWWGPLFIPAYLVNSVWHWFRGEGIYIDNDFEALARKWSGY